MTGGRVTKVTLAIGHRCPTCGQLPEDFRSVITFGRRVDELFIDPVRSIHYSAQPDGTPFSYEPMEPGIARLYPAVIVPRDLVGKVILIKPEEEVMREEAAKG